MFLVIVGYILFINKLMTINNSNITHMHEVLN